LNVTSVKEIPEYSGNVIDLSTYNISTLYKGNTKQFVADKLNAKGIAPPNVVSIPNMRLIHPLVSSIINTSCNLSFRKTLI
jgi:hypothetical protein